MWKAVKEQKFLILYVLVIIMGLFYFGQRFQNGVKADEIDETQQVENFDSVMGAVPKNNWVFKGNLSVNQQMKLINQLVNLDPRFYNYLQYKEVDELDYIFYKDSLSFVLLVKKELNLQELYGDVRLNGLSDEGTAYRFDDDMKFMYSFNSREINGKVLESSKTEFFYSSVIGGEFERFFPLIHQLNGTNLGVNDYLVLNEDYSGYKYVSEFPRSADNTTQRVEFRIQKKILSKMIEIEPNLYNFQGLMAKGSELRYLLSYDDNRYQLALFNSHESTDIYYGGMAVESNDMAVYMFDENGNYMYRTDKEYYGHRFYNIIYSNFYGTSFERLWKALEYMNGTPEGSSGIVTIPEKEEDTGDGGSDTGQPSEPSEPSDQDTPPEEEEEESGMKVWFADLWDTEKYKFDNDFLEIFSMIGMYSRLFDFNYHLWNGGAPSEEQIEQLGPYWANYIRPSYGLAAFEINVFGIRFPFTEIQELISQKTYWISMIIRSLITFSTITYCYNKLRQTFAPMY